jgi:hypothetical protein
MVGNAGDATTYINSLIAVREVDVEMVNSNVVGIAVDVNDSRAGIAAESSVEESDPGDSHQRISRRGVDDNGGVCTHLGVDYRLIRSHQSIVRAVPRARGFGARSLKRDGDIDRKRRGPSAGASRNDNHVAVDGKVLRTPAGSWCGVVDRCVHVRIGA